MRESTISKQGITYSVAASTSALVRPGPVKSCEQQAVLALHRTRSHWVSVRTATVNALRGLLYEFGIVLCGGRKAGLKTLAQQRAQIDEQLPPIMRGLVDGQLTMLSQLEQRIDALEHEITALEKQLDKARRCVRCPASAYWAPRHWPPR
jgi:transposase